MVIIELSKENKNFVDDILSLADNPIVTVNKKLFDGVDSLVQIGIVLTPLIIPALANIILEIIKNKQKVNIKVDGVEVEGLNETNALVVLNRLLDERKNSE